MAKEQTALSFGKGITNVPGDATCDDNALEECMGMVFSDGEHRVIQKPVDLGLNIADRILFVHKSGGKERIIACKETAISGQETNYDIVWYDVDGRSDDIVAGLSSEHIVVAAVGKTLIINVDGTVYYALWKSDGYMLLGNRIPDVELRFSMSAAQCKMEDLQEPQEDRVLEDLTYGQVTLNVSSTDDTDIGTISGHEHERSQDELNKYPWAWFVVQKQDEFDNALIAIVSAHLNDVKGVRRFCFPFWVRYALRLYDGTHTNISNPILMMPSVHHNCNAYLSETDGEYKDPYDNHGFMPVMYDPYSSELQYQVVTPLAGGWEDVVVGVDIFVSEEVRSFDLEGHWSFMNPFGTTTGNDVRNEVRRDTRIYEGVHVFDAIPETQAVDLNVTLTREQKKAYTPYILPKHWTETEFINRLLDASVFYKLIELDAGDVASATEVLPATDKIDSAALKNLRNQTQLENDDYYSHTQMAANIMKTYNARLHLADVTRGFFDGFAHFSDVTQNGSYDAILLVYIDGEDGERIVRREANTSEDFGWWLYYPDPRARKMEIYTTGEEEGHYAMLSVNLKEHPHLNGAYAFVSLPHGNGLPGTEDVTAVPDENNEPEHLVNRVFVSGADNPYVFTGNGDVTVGNGRIKGMATQTVALGQEEHGIHPLTVFTDDGISGLRLNAEGVYTHSDLFSREVCNNPRSITEVDGAVFFSSAKGLMMVVGSQVKCMSEQLCGKSGNPFQAWLKDAFIAYDYRDSLLWIFDGGEHDGVAGSRYCWIYSIKSGTFSRYDFGAGVTVTNVVADYPDYLLQSGSSIFSLLERPDINADGVTAGNVFVANTYDAAIVTRPIKLENALSLKSIRQIRNVHYMEGRLRYRLFASNDLKRWVELKSLRGMPWKYFKMRFDFTGLKATDRFCGTVVVAQERRTNKLR